MSEIGAAGRDGVVAALRSLASTYVGARRAGDELRTRLAAIEEDRVRLLSSRQQVEYGSSSDRELAEVERVRRTLARSSAASAEHLRALEAVITAVAGDALRVLGRVSPASSPASPAPASAAAPAPPAPTAAPTPPRAAHAPVERAGPPPTVPPTRPDALVRGGWSPPPPDEQAGR